jgi:hypothetical protein
MTNLPAEDYNSVFSYDIIISAGALYKQLKSLLLPNSSNHSMPDRLAKFLADTFILFRIFSF